MMILRFSSIMIVLPPFSGFNDMPRLSVDLDFDFCRSVTREEMLECRKQINEDLKRYLASQGYQLNPEKSKDPHSLDSWVFWYINAAVNRDNIKIEINYSLREHLFPVKQMPIQTELGAIKKLKPRST